MAKTTDSSGVAELPQDDPIMTTRDLDVVFQMDRGESQVLKSVDIDIQRNEILGIVGESGSGKSMFASALLDAVVEPGQTRGEVTYYSGDGEQVDVFDLKRKELKKFRWEKVSMVFQGAMSSFNPTMKIRGHFEETLEAHDANKEAGMERAHQLLSDLHLDSDRVLGSYPHELSGGMKQRILIALSMILQPDVLVMDEPTASLDLLMQQSIISLINDIKEKYDLTILFITHDLPLIAGLADRLAVMYAFEFVEVGPANEILRDAAHPYARALLKATPNLDTDIEEMRPIEGESPDPVNVPSGCSYHTRCPLADSKCESIDPDPYIVNEEHTVNCHYWEDVDEHISIDYSTEYASDSKPENSTDRSGLQDPVLSLENVEVHFDTNKGLFDFLSDPEVVRAVDGVSHDIYEEDVLVLVGESGCGKTTLGKTAIGVQRPTGGSVKYRGQDIWETKDNSSTLPFLKDKNDESGISYQDIRRSLQIIHQDPGSSLNPHRRVSAILSDTLRVEEGLNSEERRKRILEMLDKVRMTPPEAYIDRYPHQLSGGEKQRIALIRAVLADPALILADEPVSSLDVSLRVEMMDLMMSVQDEFKTSYLFVSHNLSNARYMAGKTGGLIGVMYLGELIEVGTAEQIINDPQHPYTQALRWATPKLDPDAAKVDDELPLRSIDIPDPINPPSGCRFHNRCPEAREVCASEKPKLTDSGEGTQRAACFRTEDDHEYWNSDPLAENDD